MKKIKFNDTNIYISKILPFKGYLAMMLFGFIIYRKEYEYQLYDKLYINRIFKMINHENIHKEQIKDFGLPFFFFKPLQILFGGLIFYIMYILEWIFNIFRYGYKEAYHNISFEREAIKNESNLSYIPSRKHFSNYRKL